MNERLRRARIHAGFTQEELARSLGVSSVSIHRWERQGKQPSPFYRQVIGEFFHLPETAFWPQEDSGKKRQRQPNGPLLDLSVPTLSLHAGLIGHQALLTRLYTQLEDSSPEQILSLTGWPGQGKTRILQALATLPHVRQTFDGIVWATVGPHSHPLQHLQRWGRLLGLPALPESPEQARECLRLAIGSRRMLFLLDDLWENEVFAYLVGGAQCRYVFTTRSPRLALSQSHAVYRIPELSDDEALTLLTRSLPPPFTQTYRRRLEQLVQQVGKLPLALVLLGEPLRCEARASSPRRFEEALCRLAQDAVFLKIPCSTHIHAHQPCSLSTAISKSVRQLPPLPKKALACLVQSLPAPTAPFTEQQFMSLHQGSLHVHLLDDLVDAGLLEWNQHGYYRLHPVVAAYARAFFAKNDEQERLAG